MILIIGGVYQGKKAFAMELKKTLRKELQKEIEIVDSCDRLIRKQLDDGENPEEIYEFWRKQSWDDKILIFNDVSMGIVPIEKKDRVFRETVGKVSCVLAKKADRVYGVFCGISKRLK